jgi:ATP-dependent DNA helicase DinG
MDLPAIWTLDQASKEAIIRGIRLLADNCDGAKIRDNHGFDRFDTQFGHQLAELTDQQWTPGRYFAGYRMVWKYRAQLAGLIDVASITKPEDPKGATPEADRAGRTTDVSYVADDGRTLIRHVFGGTPDAIADGIRALGTPAPWRPASIEEVADMVFELTDGQTDVLPELKSPDPIPDPSLRAISDADQIEANVRALRSTGLSDAPWARHGVDILGPGGLIASKLEGYEHRAEQLEMVDLVEHAMTTGQNALVEAGTGTGKSLGYLVPAILVSQQMTVDAEERDDDGLYRSKVRRVKTIVSTADKALQEQIWGKDIPFLKRTVGGFEAAILKGRGNYLCLYALDRTMKAGQAPGLPGMEQPGFESIEDVDRFAELNAWATQTVAGDLEELPFIVSGTLRDAVAVDSDGCIGHNCPFRKRCFSERARRAAGDADIVIVNHALLLRDVAMTLSSEGGAGVLPDAEFVVIDEAHHLEDIATDAFGFELTGGTWKRLVTRLAKMTVLHPDIVGEINGAAGTTENSVLAVRLHAEAEAIGTELDAWFDYLGAILDRRKEDTLNVGDHTALVGLTAANIWKMAEALKESAPYWISDDADRDVWDKIAKAFVDFGNKLTAIVSPQDPMKVVRYAENTGAGRFARVVVNLKPIDVSEALRAGLWDNLARRAVIACSATIATDAGFRFFRDRVGCDDAAELIVSSPFDYAQAAMLYLPQDGKTFDPRSIRGEDPVEYLDQLAAEIERLILASKGRAFVLFTSNKAMNEVYNRLSPRLTKYLVLKQGDHSRPELVRRFKEDGAAILFGVKSFWEGVDVQGDSLSLVIIDKLPFVPPSDPVWAARCDAVNRKTGDDWGWFHQLAIPNAIIALKQGFGRLIRTKADRGVVAILDGRLTTKGYGARIVRSMPPATVTRSRAAVQSFFLTH